MQKITEANLKEHKKKSFLEGTPIYFWMETQKLVIVQMPLKGPNFYNPQKLCHNLLRAECQKPPKNTSFV